jgi:hypothetical protein
VRQPLTIPFEFVLVVGESAATRLELGNEPGTPSPGDATHVWHSSVASIARFHRVPRSSVPRQAVLCFATPSDVRLYDDIDVRAIIKPTLRERSYVAGNRRHSVWRARRP